MRFFFVMAMVLLSMGICECRMRGNGSVVVGKDAGPPLDWKNGGVFKTDAEVQQFIRLIQYFSMRKDIGSLIKLRKWYVETLHSARMKRCIQKFHSNICTNNVGFYIWAQLLAKDMMNGKFSK